MPNLQDLKSKIIHEIPITSIVGHYLTLTRKGTATLAVCPFHQDTHPSMHVTDDKKMYKCFACNAGGNAIDFVMNYKNLSFIDTMKEISNDHGLNFDDYSHTKKKSPKILMAEKILARATMLYERFAKTGKYPEFVNFLKNRNLSEDVAGIYSLGYAPKNNALLDYLNSIESEKERKFALEIGLELGLFKEDQNNQSLYDTFRDRIIFPIWDQYGQTVGFTSRAVFDYQKAKYMNSKDSFAFNKRNILYGLHLAKKSIRSNDSILLVEGNMDQIALYKNGFENSLAVMGVALGDSSLRTIKALTSNVFLALDGDEAGWNAAIRINLQFMAVGIMPRFLNFSPQKDPDDYLATEGPLKLKKQLESAPLFIDVQMEKLIPSPLPELLDKQLTILTECFKVLSPLRDSIVATEKLVNIALKIGLKSGAEQVLSAYREFLKGLPLEEKKFNNSEPLQIDDGPFGDPMEMDFLPAETEPYASSHSKFTRLDKRLLCDLIPHPELLMHTKIAELLDFVVSNEVKEYVSLLKELYYEIDENEYVPIAKKILQRGSYSEGLIEITLTALNKHRFTVKKPEVVEKYFQDLKRKLLEEEFRMQKDLLKVKKNSCETKEELNAIMQELIIIDKEILKRKSKRI